MPDDKTQLGPPDDVVRDPVAAGGDSGHGAPAEKPIRRKPQSEDNMAKGRKGG